MKKLFAVALLTLSFSAHADSAAPVAPDAWMGARPNVQITVSHGTTPDTYTINAVVSDLRTGNVLAKLVMVARAGSPARAEIGGVGVKGMVSVAFTVTVDSSGQTAAYSSEVRDNAEVVASQSATLAVAK
ncbi:MAG: hypothetical protein L0Z53_18870 [Acidobacteriales bacterium]|nr:hypothetical protein [Terriglobales bacterium]